MQRIKTIRSYSDLHRWLSELSQRPIGYLPRQTQIPSPYASSPTDVVWNWNGRRVIYREVSHRRFEVFELPANMHVHPCEDDAVNEYLGGLRR